MSSSEYFRHCSTCKKKIPFGGNYYKCSVSTCNRRATALYFCSVPCWDAHVPDARHRDAWAEQEVAPSAPPPAPSTTESTPLRRKVTAVSASLATQANASGDGVPQDVLVVMSKLKAYIRARADMKTSDGVSQPLSEHMREICDKAISSARTNERRTVLARDIEAAVRGDNAVD